MKSLMVLQTDFGFGGGCAMRGTCLKVDPELEVFDGTHTIPKFNVASAARHLIMMVPYWPEGTVFVSVVDPGVGTARRASVARLKNGSYVVSPDNGSFSRLLEVPGIEAIRVIDETRNRLKGTEKTSIFHGRDLFAYCGARLAPVLENILTMVNAGVHVEITNLLVTGLNDSPESVSRLCQWMADNNLHDVPLHFSRYFPRYRMKQPGPTPAATLFAARETALSFGIKDVFLGNI